MLTRRILFYLSTCSSLLVAAAEGFNPRAYTKHTAVCPAVHRNGGKGEPRDVSITMSYVDLNPTANRTLLFVHGWPGLWSGWSNQIQHFQDRYRLIVPDLRGFGDSTHPGDVQASGTHGDLVGDLVCVLEKAGVTKAVCVGHDWGTQLCYEAARMRPDLFEAVIGSVIPYLPAAADKPMDMSALSKVLPKLTYNLYFQKSTDAAVAELDTDIRRSLRSALRSVASPPPTRFLRSPSSFLKAYRHMDTIPPSPLMTTEEEDYYVEQYSKQGFGNTLQFYTRENKYRSWEFSHSQGNLTIPKPVLAIYPTRDPVADWPLVALIVGAPKFLPYMTTRAISTAHSCHMERPAEFNAMMEEWLDELDVKLLEAKLGETKKEMNRLKKEINEMKKKRGKVQGNLGGRGSKIEL